MVVDKNGGWLVMRRTLSAPLPLLVRTRVCCEVWPELARRLDRARERTAHGERFAAALEAEQVIWPPALRLIAIGEANGRLAEMVQKAGTMAQTEAERRIRVRDIDDLPHVAREGSSVRRSQADSDFGFVAERHHYAASCLGHAGRGVDRVRECLKERDR